MNEKEKWKEIIHQMALEGLEAQNVIGYDEEGKEIKQYKYFTSLTPASSKYDISYSTNGLTINYKALLNGKEYTKQKYNVDSVSDNGNVRTYVSSLSYDDFWKQNKCMFLENKDAKKLIVLSASDVVYHNPYTYEPELSGTYNSNLSVFVIDTSRSHQQVKDAVYNAILDQNEQKALDSVRLFQHKYEVSEFDALIRERWFNYKLNEDEEMALIEEMDRYSGDWVNANANIHVSLFLEEYEKMESLVTKCNSIIDEQLRSCYYKSLDELLEIILSYDSDNLTFNGTKFESLDELNLARSVVVEQFEFLGEITKYNESSMRQKNNLINQSNESLHADAVRMAIIDSLSLTKEEVDKMIAAMPVNDSAQKRTELWQESVILAEKEVEAELNKVEELENRHLTDLEFNELKKSSYAALVWTKAVKYVIAKDNTDYLKELKEGNIDNYLKMVNVLSRPIKDISPRNNHFRLAMCNVSYDDFGNRYIPIYTTGNTIDNSLIKLNGKQQKKAKKENKIPIFNSNKQLDYLPTVVCYPQTEDIHYYNKNGEYLGYRYIGTDYVNLMNKETGKGTISVGEFEKENPGCIDEMYPAYRVSKNTLSISQYPFGYNSYISEELRNIYDYTPNKENDWQNEDVLRYAKNIQTLAQRLDNSVEVIKDDISLKKACLSISSVLVNGMMEDASEETKQTCIEYFSNCLLSKNDMLNSNTVSIEGTINYAQKLSENDMEKAGLEMYSTQRFVDNIMSECYSNKNKFLSLPNLLSLDCMDILSENLNSKKMDLEKNVSALLATTLNITSKEQLADDIFSYKYENNPNLLNRLYEFPLDKNNKSAYLCVTDYDISLNKATLTDLGTMVKYTIPNFDKLIQNENSESALSVSKIYKSGTKTSSKEKITERVLE